MPSEFYLSKDVFELERHAIFGQNWLWAGRSDQLKSAGDYISGRILSEPYIVNIDSTSQLRAHYNVCCHHGMCLVSESHGQVKNQEFVCPYHGWTYNLNGRLKKALRLKNIDNFKASQIKLKPIEVQNIGPFIYVNFNFTNRTSIKEDLSHVKEIDEKYLKSTDYDQLEFITRRTYRLNCNWKIFIDNYLDGGYHVPFAHKQLTSLLDMDAYKTVIENRKSSVQYASGQERASGKVIYAFLYPNLMINRYGPYMDVNIVIPVDERTCLVHMDYFYCPKSVTKSDDEKSRIQSHRVQQEDVFLCENVQLGLESQAYDCGRYAPTVEHAMHSFHQTLYEELYAFYEQSFR